ncbi:unnamed protein product [Staurois parvus]|uniref:Uncharacterized protein n=1 Tax=Staurois parvus TaxID=386267 RepID=A0ABN9EBA0_9NEOB|nr:unnamed protein product [Staurois parvus]
MKFAAEESVSLRKLLRNRTTQQNFFLRMEKFRNMLFKRRSLVLLRRFYW